MRRPPAQSAPRTTSSGISIPNRDLQPRATDSPNTAAQVDFSYQRMESQGRN